MESTRLDLASRLPWAVFPRKRLDASFADFYAAALHCLEAAPDEAGYAAFADAAEQAFHPTAPTQALATLSVRTTWDLFLHVLDLPPGSEVVMSGVTIKDMVHIPLSHGLVPIAVDIDPETLEMDPEKLAQAITPRTRVIVVSHIFGAIGDATMRRVTDIAWNARPEGGGKIVVFEDCAEAYVGPDYRGHPDSTVVAFSFGTIKTDTALGGCLSVVSDPALLDRMRAANYRLLRRTHRFFLKRVLKYLGAHSIMRPDLWGLVIKAARLAGVDHDQIITAVSRGFPGNMLEGIRHRPSVPLLRLLHRRISNFDAAKLTRRCELAHKLRQLLEDYQMASPSSSSSCSSSSAAAAASSPLSSSSSPPSMSFWVPGREADSHSYWLFPVCLGAGLDLPGLCTEMTRRGFDVTSGATQLGAVSQYVPDPTALFQELAPVRAAGMMKRVVYLPVVAEMPEFVLRDMGAAFMRVVEQQLLAGASTTGGDDGAVDDDDLDLDGLDLDDLDVDGDGDGDREGNGDRRPPNGGSDGGVRTSKPPAFTCHSKL